MATAKPKPKETSLAIKDSNYALFRSSVEETGEAIKVNVGGNLEATGLPKMSIPSGGGSSFDYPTLEGIEPKKDVEGVIVSFNDFRAFWDSPYDGGQTPPDCYSNDLQIGIGEPGGECPSCPNSQWGSDANNSGQACTLKRRLLFIPEDRTLPVVLDVPPSSLKPAREYFLNLASFGKKFFHTVTKFSLETDKSGDGIKYSKLKLERVRDLDDAEKVLIDSYEKSIKESMGQN
jgi:hypothetical protein